MTPDRIKVLIDWNEQRAKLAQYEEDAQAHRASAEALGLLLPAQPASPPPPAAAPSAPTARARKRAQ
jgi:hypothetical protein